jgi:hypothetical protein
VVVENITVNGCRYSLDFMKIHSLDTGLFGSTAAVCDVPPRGNVAEAEPADQQRIYPGPYAAC